MCFLCFLNGDILNLNKQRAKLAINVMKNADQTNVICWYRIIEPTYCNHIKTKVNYRDMYSKITVASETPKTSMKNLWTLLYGHLVVNNTFGFKKLNSPLTFPTCGDYLNIKIYIT